MKRSFLSGLFGWMDFAIGVTGMVSCLFLYLEQQLSLVPSDSIVVGVWWVHLTAAAPCSGPRLQCLVLCLDVLGGTYAVDLLEILLGWCSGLCLIWTHQSVSCW